MKHDADLYDVIIKKQNTNELYLMYAGIPYYNRLDSC